MAAAAARPEQQAGGDDGGVDVGLDDQRVAERLGDDHHLDGSAADAADVLGQCRAEDAQLVGEGPPDVGLPAGAGLGGGPAAVSRS